MPLCNEENDLNSFLLIINRSFNLTLNGEYRGTKAQKKRWSETTSESFNCGKPQWRPEIRYQEIEWERKKLKVSAWRSNETNEERKLMEVRMRWKKNGLHKTGKFGHTVSLSGCLPILCTVYIIKFRLFIFANLID